MIRRGNLADLDRTLETLSRPAWDDAVDDGTRWSALVVFAGLMDVRPPKQDDDHDEWLRKLVARVVDYSMMSPNGPMSPTAMSPKSPKIKKHMIVDDVGDWQRVLFAVHASVDLLMSSK